MQSLLDLACFYIMRVAELLKVFVVVSTVQCHLDVCDVLYIISRDFVSGRSTSLPVRISVVV